MAIVVARREGEGRQWLANKMLSMYAMGDRDFTRYMVEGVDLSGADLSGSVLHGVNFNRGNLRGANLSGCNIYGVDFANADLTNADLTDTTGVWGATWWKTTLDGANFTGTKIDAYDTSFEWPLASLTSRLVYGQVSAVGIILPRLVVYELFTESQDISYMRVPE